MNDVIFKKYLRKQKIYKIKILTVQLLLILIAITIWQFLSSKNIISTFLFSSPTKVVNTIIKLYSQNSLMIHIWVTLKEIIISFSLGSVISLLLATILWWYPFINKVMEPYLTILNSLPKIALGPIIIIWVGANQNSIILMALMISVISSVIAIYTGFNDTNKNRIRLLKSFNASKFQIYKSVILPSNLKTIISTLKINLSMTFVGVIMGELLVSKEGIGYLINYGSQVFNINLVISGVIILSILTSILYFLILHIEKKIAKE